MKLVFGAAALVILGAGCSSGGDQNVSGSGGNGGAVGGSGGAGSGGLGATGGAATGGSTDGRVDMSVDAGGDAGTDLRADTAVDPMPTMLSQTGLFSDIKTQTLAPGVYAYEPQYALWSDGATKRRWIYLPPGQQIVTDNMDFWEYPEGTKLWKEFTRDGKLIETRLLMKRSVGLADWYMMAFKWNADHSEAVAVPDGEMNVDGTQHDIPSKDNCGSCHSTMWDNVLGFSALQLSHNLAGLNLDKIVAMGWLSTPPTSAPTLPGDQIAKDALGYLHANCGICHNERAKPYQTKVDLDLWTHLDQVATLQTTRAYLSSVCDVWPAGLDKTHDKTNPIASCPAGHATGAPLLGNISRVAKRITPHNPAQSALHELMMLREPTTTQMRQMPPLATKIPDPMGLAKVDAWINSLP